MVADPCNAELVPGLYGTNEGVISRYKRTLQLAETNEYGFCLWCPTYGGRNSNEIENRYHNFIAFSPAAINTNIVNTDGDPMGLHTNTSGGFQAVGAGGFMEGGTVKAFRTLSACLKLQYVGSTSDCAGRIALLENIPTDILMDLPNVQDILNYATRTERLSLETQEVTFRPNNESSKFKDPTTVFLQSNFVDEKATTMDPTTQFDQPKFIGFAWAGVPSNQLVFETIQNIEWKPDTGLGYVQTPIRQDSSTPSFTAALSWLDQRFPNWSTTAFNVAGRAAGRLIDSVLGGPRLRSIGYQPNVLRIMN